MKRQTSTNTLSRSDSAKPLQGRVALITGATRGIGLASSRALAAKGCNLIVTGRDQSALARISRDLSRLVAEIPYE